MHAGLSFTSPRNTGPRAHPALLAERLTEVAEAFAGAGGSREDGRNINTAAAKLAASVGS